jgi:hypothetical protein
LHGHQQELRAMSKAFRTIGDTGRFPKTVDEVQRLRADLQLFADDLQQQKNGSRAARVSPRLLFLAAGGPSRLVPE